MAWSISLVVCGHLIWSGLGIAYLLREFKVKRLGQAIGGLAFSLSGYLVARAGFLSINAAAAWIPWLLLFLYRYAERKSKNLIGLTVVVSMLLLAGHAQTAWHAFLLGGIWAVYWSVIRSDNGNRGKKLGRSLVGFVCAVVLGIGISTIQLLPTVEYLFFSQRAVEYGYESAMTYSFWPWRFLTLIAPDLFGNPAWDIYWGYGNYWEDAVYIGLLPLILALGFLARSVWKKLRKTPQESISEHFNLGIFLGAIVLVSFLLALGDNTVIFPFLYKYMPGMDLFQAPTRYTILAEISLALLAGFGVDQLTKPAGKRLYFIRLVVAGCVSVIAGAVLGMIFLEGIRISFLYAVGRAGIIGLFGAVLSLMFPDKKNRRMVQVWNILLMILISLDLLSAGWGLNPGIEADFYDFSTPMDPKGRVWMPQAVEYNQKFRKFFRFDTFSPGVNWQDIHQDFLPNLPVLQGIEMVNNFDPMVPAYYQAWMDSINAEFPDQHILQMMNVSHIVDSTDEEGIELIQLDYPIEPVRIAGCKDVVDAQALAVDDILNSDHDLLKDIIVISEDHLPCSPGGEGTVEIVEMRNGYLDLNLELVQDGWLFWSQAWYPGWVYRIDGGSIHQTYRVNYLFQGVPVPKSAQQVELMYRPASMIWGIAITGLSLAIGVTVFVMRRKFISGKDED